MGRFERREGESVAEWLARLEAFDRASLSSGEEVEYNATLAAAREQAGQPSGPVRTDPPPVGDP